MACLTLEYHQYQSITTLAISHPRTQILFAVRGQDSLHYNGPSMVPIINPYQGSTVLGPGCWNYCPLSEYHTGSGVLALLTLISKVLEYQPRDNMANGCSPPLDPPPLPS